MACHAVGYRSSSRRVDVQHILSQEATLDRGGYLDRPLFWFLWYPDSPLGLVAFSSTIGSIWVY